MNREFLEAAGSRNAAGAVQVAHVGGHFDLWVDDDAPVVACKLVRAVVPPVRFIANRVLPGRNNPWFSPLLLAIYRKPGTRRCNLHWAELVDQSDERRQQTLRRVEGV
jgi:hypothetical protein